MSGAERHQDLTSLGIIIEIETLDNLPNVLRLGNEELTLSNNKGPWLQNNYDFYQITRMPNKNETISYPILPQESRSPRIMSVITSSAKVPKRLCCNAYVTLIN